PQPDSPTSPSVSPRAMSKLTPDTACTVLLPTVYSTTRLSTLNNGEVEACCIMRRCHRTLEPRLLALAAAVGVAAARRKRAALQRPRRIGRTPGDRRKRGVWRGVELRNRGQQRLGVGHVHVLEQHGRRRALDHAAGIHH